MFWFQVGICFIGWVYAGSICSRRTGWIHERTSRWSRVAKAFSGAGLLLLALAALFVPLNLLLTTRALQEGPMSVPVWLAVGAVGLAFVTLNGWAVGLLVALAQQAHVTHWAGDSSTKEESS